MKQGRVVRFRDAILSSVATISCCLPLGLAAALGPARQAFSRHASVLGLSVVLLAWDSGSSIAQGVFDRGRMIGMCCCGSPRCRVG